MFGMNVRVVWAGSPCRNHGKEATLHNVTEIHFLYPSPDGKRVAFESNIHGTGVTYPVSYIAEFEATVAESKAIDFF